MGVTEAVGEEEDREEAEVMAIREEEPPSGAEMSLFISSLLLRDTGHHTNRQPYSVADTSSQQVTPQKSDLCCVCMVGEAIQ